MKKLVVVGGGPAGYGAALKAAANGIEVTLVEQSPLLGGTCLRVGCIPTKTLLETSRLYQFVKQGAEEHGLAVQGIELNLQKMYQRKNQVMKKLAEGLAGLVKRAGIKVITGKASCQANRRLEIICAGGKTEILEVEQVLLATGSQPIAVPGLEFDQRQIIDSTKALALEKVPERLVVVGGGAVGLELGQLWQRLGAQVTVVEMMDQIIPSGGKKPIAQLTRVLKKRGLEILCKTRVAGCKKTPEGLELVLDGQAGHKTISATHVLVAVGRRPLPPPGLHNWGVQTDERGRVKVNERLETSAAGVYAAGDLVAGPMLAHKAHYDGEFVAQQLLGGEGQLSYRTIPSVVYTWPEFAAVGFSEEQCQQQGLEFVAGTAYFAANGRALSAADSEGLIQVVAEKGSGRLLGVHMVGPHASELIGQAVVAMEAGLSAQILSEIVQAHPTLSEVIRDAAHSACAVLAKKS